MNAADRLVIEAMTAARNWKSVAAREASGREVAAISVGELVRGCGDGHAHALNALRSATLALAISPNSQTEALADAIRALARAIRSEPLAPRGNAKEDATPRRYWIDQP